MIQAKAPTIVSAKQWWHCPDCHNRFPRPLDGSMPRYSPCNLDSPSVDVLSEQKKNDVHELREYKAPEPHAVVRTYDVHMTIRVKSTSDVDTSAEELLLEEAMTSLLDEEVLGGGTRCGLEFHDAESADARFVEEEDS
jgi:hypothetical protein